MKRKSKEITSQEARDIFMRHMAHLIQYWSQVDSVHKIDGQSETEWRLSGLMHSTLCAIDGSSCAVPAYELIPKGTSEDKKYAIEKGFDYYETQYDIAGGLHDLLCKYMQGKVEKPKNLYTFSDYTEDEFFKVNYKFNPEKTNE